MTSDLFVPRDRISPLLDSLPTFIDMLEEIKQQNNILLTQRKYDDIFNKFFPDGFFDYKLVRHTSVDLFLKRDINSYPSICASKHRILFHMFWIGDYLFDYNFCDDETAIFVNRPKDGLFLYLHEFIEEMKLDIPNDIMEWDEDVLLQLKLSLGV